MELSPRLAAVADLVPPGARLADVGTDHAYLPAYLILNGRIQRSIAADIRPGPLDHARRTAAEYHLADRLEFRLCDGLERIAPEECDTITIAGMGGETIAGILDRARWTQNGKRLILQPQSTQNVLRSFLSHNGWRIVSERVVREGERWYPILLVEGGAMRALSPGEEIAGCPETWAGQEERLGYLEWLLGQCQRQLHGLSRSSKPEDAARRDTLLSAASFLKHHCLEWSHRSLTTSPGPCYNPPQMQ